ncbi:M23 family metallopeptidase [Massiliimalia timonensis]|uniref:M23 family metallopeptidase n=1 Tax=Massiliimalia timonensis TaxID=1987501 RepID=UPI000B8B2C7D|nr:M23 family metallopeptidase [Massiliimalia timonensis]MBS7174608.1 M23 family metallopeptidase [Clostridiales bacterium]
MIKNWNELDLSEELYEPPKEVQDNELEEQKPRESGFFSTLTFQVILCLVIAIILVLMNTFFPSQYHDIDSELKKQIQQDGGFSEDMARWKGQFDSWLNKEKDTPTVVPDTSQPASEAGTEESITAESTAGDAGKETSQQSGEEAAEKAAGGEPNGSDVPENVSLEAFSFDQKIAAPLTSLTVTSEFGARTHPITKEADFHKGTDLAAEEGDDIYAVLSGTVVESEFSEGYGNHIRLRHQDGTESFYAHCSKLLAKEGDQIKQGEVIAKVGSTGTSTGPHLHFGYLIHGKFVDPTAVLEHA